MSDHGTNAVSEDGKRTVEIATLAREEEKHKAAGAELKRRRKIAEERGLNLKAYDRALKIFKRGKTIEFITETAAITQYLRLLGMAIPKSQLDLFSAEAVEDRRPLDERAYEDGLTSGRMDFDGSVTSPHDPSTAAFQKWMVGYHQGCEERRLIMSMTATNQVVAAEAVKRGRGRPKGSGKKAAPASAAVHVEPAGINGIDATGDQSAEAGAPESATLPMFDEEQTSPGETEARAADVDSSAAHEGTQTDAPEPAAEQVDEPEPETKAVAAPVDETLQIPAFVDRRRARREALVPEEVDEFGDRV